MKKPFLIILIFIFNLSLWAQTPNKAFYEIDNGLRLNVDIIRPILSMTQKNYTGYEINADFGIKPKLFLAAEMGSQNRTKTSQVFDHTIEGNYFKIGIDRNFMNFENSTKDIVFVGLRYGLGFVEHSFKNVIVFDQYWGNSAPVSLNEKFTAHWAEIVFGMKTPVFKNFYMGWDVRAKLLLANSNTLSNRPYIPGFGQPSINTLKASTSIHYYLSYRIPFKKQMIWDIPKEEKDK